MLARILAVALLAVPSTARAAPQRLDRASPVYRSAQFVPPSPATYAAPETAEAPGRRAAIRRAAPAPPGGALPNQRTGPMRDHVVRDICVGC